MDAEWTPWFAWSMDLVKFIFTFGLSALVTIYIIDRFQEKGRKAARRADALFQIDMNALAEFQRTAVQYEVLARAAYVDLYQWQCKDKTANMSQYESTGYGGYLAGVAALERRFGGDQGILQSLECYKLLQNQRHALYDWMVDHQLDSRQPVNLWSLADEHRKEYNMRLEQAAEARQEVVTAVEKRILSNGS